MVACNLFSNWELCMNEHIYCEESIVQKKQRFNYN